MRTLLVAAGAAALFAAAAGQVQAAEQDAAQGKSVHIATKVDYQNPAAVKTLYAKLQRAARQACDSRTEFLEGARADRRCAQELLGQAVREIDRPALASVHNAGVTGLAQASSQPVG